MEEVEEAFFRTDAIAVSYQNDDDGLEGELGEERAAEIGGFTSAYAERAASCPGSR